MVNNEVNALFSDIFINSPWIKLQSHNWDCLKDAAKLKYYKKNTILYNSNQFSKHVYIVDSGRVELSIVSIDGCKKIIGICDKDSMFGELPIFDNKTNFCTARVCSNANIYEIEPGLFMEKLLSNKNLFLSILESLTSKIRILYTQVEFLAFHSAAERVALVLLSMCKDYGKKEAKGYRIDISFSHNDIANMTGLSRVSVTNTLLKFMDENILYRDSKNYIISDLEKLKSYLNNDLNMLL